MKAMKMVFYVAIMILGLVFTGLFIMELLDTALNPGDYLFFQIIMVLVWFGGAIVFDIVSIVLIRQIRRERNEVRQRD
jgi:inner membrane protein involved in colicin E2 resistance